MALSVLIAEELKMREVLDLKVWYDVAALRAGEIEEVEYVDAVYLGTRYGDLGYRRGVVWVALSTHAL
jgi:hypothetical protein